MKKLFRLLGAVMLSFVVCMSVHTKAAAASFNYELVCNIGRRVPRVYNEGGIDTVCVNYLL